MPSHDEMAATVHAYVAAFEAGDPDAVTALFAADGTVEDPVGGDPQRGHDAIRAFYTQAMQTGARLRLEGEVRTAANTAAFAFNVLLHHDGADRRIDVIDTFAFDQAGKVAQMRAYWSPGNMHGFEEL